MTATNPSGGAAVVPPGGDLELRLTRLIDAPRELVFRAWTEPEMLAKWMAPRGMSPVPQTTVPAAPGVSFRIAMHDDGGDPEVFVQLGTYREVVPSERLVYTFAWEGDDGRPEHESTITVTFAERGGKTELTMHQAFFETSESRDRHVLGWTSVLDRLVDLVSPDGTFAITRFFEAPRELVFDAWTRLEHLAKWFGPPGCELVEPTVDLRPGGRFRYGMRDPGGNVAWGSWTFREVVRPERLECIVAFTDEAGTPVRHPMAPEWPLLTRSVATFEARGDRTLLVLRNTPFEATEGEIAVFVAGHASMNGGWTPAFEALARYLASLSSS